MSRKEIVMIRGDERHWANAVLGAIENLECPMLMYEGEKMIVRKALKAYLAESDAEQTEPNEKNKDCTICEHNEHCHYLAKDIPWVDCGWK